MNRDNEKPPIRGRLFIVAALDATTGKHRVVFSGCTEDEAIKFSSSVPEYQTPIIMEDELAVLDAENKELRAALKTHFKGQLKDSRCQRCDRLFLHAFDAGEREPK